MGIPLPRPTALAASGEPAPISSQTCDFLLGRDAALCQTFGIVLALGTQQVGLQRLRGFDQRQQACGARSDGTIGEQATYQAVLPKLLPWRAGSKRFLLEHSQQRLLEGIELARPQPATAS